MTKLLSAVDSKLNDVMARSRFFSRIGCITCKPCLFMVSVHFCQSLREEAQLYTRSKINPYPLGSLNKSHGRPLFESLSNRLFEDLSPEVSNPALILLNNGTTRGSFGAVYAHVCVNIVKYVGGIVGAAQNTELNAKLLNDRCGEHDLI